MKNTIQAKTVKRCIVPAGRKVQLAPDTNGVGMYQILKADKGDMLSTYPMTLFVRRDEITFQF